MPVSALDCAVFKLLINTLTMQTLLKKTIADLFPSNPLHLMQLIQSMQMTPLNTVTSP